MLGLMPCHQSRIGQLAVLCREVIQSSVCIAGSWRCHMRQVLAVLCGITAVLVVANVLFAAVDPETSLILWLYLIDPAVLVCLGLVVLVHLRASLQIRNAAGHHLAQLPRDAITALEAIVGFRFLLQYIASLAPDLEETPNLWEHLDAVVIVLLAFEAIALWRSDRRVGH